MPIFLFAFQETESKSHLWSVLNTEDVFSQSFKKLKNEKQKTTFSGWLVNRNFLKPTQGCLQAKVFKQMWPEARYFYFIWPINVLYMCSRHVGGWGGGVLESETHSLTISTQCHNDTATCTLAACTTHISAQWPVVSNISQPVLCKVQSTLPRPRLVFEVIDQSCHRHPWGQRSGNMIRATSTVGACSLIWC